MRIGVAYESLGPYHFARLAAIAPSVELVAIEYSSRSATYDWERQDQSTFPCRTLFGPGEDPSVVELRKRVLTTISDAELDVIFIPGWSSPFALSLLRVACTLNVRCVLMSDSQEIDAHRRLLTESIKMAIIGLFDGALVAGSEHKHYVQRLGFGTKPLRTGYDVVDNAHFGQAPLSARPIRRYMLAVARLVPKKNLSTLLDAYCSARRAASPVDADFPDLIIAGEGPLYGDLRAQAEELGITACTRFIGRVSYPDLPQLYSGAEFLICPSSTEQWGLVVNEALASGLPVLVSSTAGCAPDLVEGKGTGEVFDHEDSRALALLIHRYATDANQLQRCRERTLDVIGRFSLQAHAMAIIELAAESSLPKVVPKNRWRLSVVDAALLVAYLRGRDNA